MTLKREPINKVITAVDVEKIVGVDKLFVKEEDINNNIDIKKDNNIDNNKDIDNDIVIDIKKDIKKYIKIKPPKPEGYHCRLPHEYILGIDEAKNITGFYKDELAQMAYDLLFKKLGIEIKKGDKNGK